MRPTISEYKFYNHVAKQYYEINNPIKPNTKYKYKCIIIQQSDIRR